MLLRRRPPAIHCLHCGRQISRRWRFCALCGEKIDLRASRAAAEEAWQPSGSATTRRRKRRSARSRNSAWVRGLAWVSQRANAFARAGMAVGGLLLLAAIWAFFVEPNLVEETHIAIPVRNLPAQLEGFRIAQISDLHIRDFGKRERRAVEIANRNKPDVVALTGDYAGGAWGSRTDQSSWELVRMIRRLRAEHGIYAVWGDWDYSVVLRQRVAYAGAVALLNQGRTLDVDGAKISFLGLGLNITDLNAALKQVNPASVKILLCHEARAQSVDEAAEAGISLTLIGGEHGGQVRLPFIGPVRPAAPENYGRKYMSGLHLIHDRMYLYANRGLGTTNLRARFLCRPEVTIVTLTRAR